MAKTVKQIEQLTARQSVEKLVDRAVTAPRPDDALKLSQAALNVSSAFNAIWIFNQTPPIATTNMGEESEQ